MFGRTFRIALLFIVCPLASGCFCCERPWFWRKHCGCNCGCGCTVEAAPCTTCCGSPGMTPGMPPVAPMAGMPVYPAPLPAGPTVPSGNPQLDRMAPISSTSLNGR